HVAGLPAEELAVDPEVAGLFLRERGVDEARAHRRAERRSVHAAEVIALPAAAVIREAMTAVLVAQRHQLARDLFDGGLPLDRLERSIASPAQRRAQSIGVVLIPIEARRLLTDVTPGRRMCVVADDAGQLAVLDGDLEPAVLRAEDARGD